MQYQQENLCNIIIREDNEVLLLIYQNNYSKDNVEYLTSTSKKQLRIFFSEENFVDYFNINIDILNILKNKNEILVAEIFEKLSFTDGSISTVYNAKRKRSLK